MACFVPFCNSNRRRKSKSNKNISFHEFPSDIDLREEWIEAIAKKDPETNGYIAPKAYDIVCSLHFSPDQFKRAFKYKANKLIPGSIPYIFPAYPQHSRLVKKYVPSCKNSKDSMNIEKKSFCSNETEVEISSQKDKQNNIYEPVNYSENLAQTSDVTCSIFISNTFSNMKKDQSGPSSVNIGFKTPPGTLEVYHADSLIHPLKNVSKTNNVSSSTKSNFSMKESGNNNSEKYQSTKKKLKK